MKLIHNICHTTCIALFATLAVGCRDNKTVLRENFDENILTHSDYWVLPEDPDANNAIEYCATEGIDNSGCIKIYSSQRTNTFISYKVVNLKPNKLYRMTAMMRTDSVEDGRGAVIYIRAENNEQIWNASEFAYGTSDWKQVYVDFVSGSDGAAELCCSLGFFGGTYNGGSAKGTVWYDNVMLTETPDEAMLLRCGKHIVLALDRDKVSISEAELDKWLYNLDKIYESYGDLIGDYPYGGNKVIILSTPGVEAGYWALAGNPILWNNHVGIDKLLKRTAENNDWNFGIMHEIGHDFNIGCTEWNWNDEIFANLRMSYALEQLGGTMSQGDILYSGDNTSYYKHAYDKTLAQGKAENNGDALHYTYMRIKNRYGWEIFKQTFGELRLTDSSIFDGMGRWDKVCYFWQVLSKHAGENVMERCYSKEELQMLKECWQ